MTSACSSLATKTRSIAPRLRTQPIHFIAVLFRTANNCLTTGFEGIMVACPFAQLPAPIATRRFTLNAKILDLSTK
jgi:hypothetical protein